MKYLLTLILFMSANIFGSYSLFYKDPLYGNWYKVGTYSDWGQCEFYREEFKAEYPGAVCRAD